MMNFIDLNVIKSVYENNSLEKANVIIEEKDYKRIILGLYTWYRFSEKESKFVKKEAPSKLPFPEAVPSFIESDLNKIILSSLILYKNTLEKVVSSYVSSTFSFSEYFELASCALYDSKKNFSFGRLIILITFSMLTGTQIFFDQYYDFIELDIERNGGWKKIDELYFNTKRENNTVSIFDHIRNWVLKSYYY